MLFTCFPYGEKAFILKINTLKNSIHKQNKIGLRDKLTQTGDFRKRSLLTKHQLNKKLLCIFLYNKRSY